MLDIIIGLFALFLGWLCFAHVSRVRALYSKARPQHSRFHGWFTGKTLNAVQP